MIGSLFLVTPDPRPTQAGQTIAQGISVGASNGQLSIADQENILSAASGTAGGAALNAKQLLAAAGLAALAGVTIGYVLGRKKR